MLIMSDMKLDITSTAFFYIVKELQNEFLNGYINNIQLVNYVSNDVLKIKIHKGKTKELIVTSQVLFVTDLVLPVNLECGGLIKFLKKKLYNQRIQEINQDKNNRVVYFKLDDYYLIFEFFSKSNIILTDLEFNIVTAKQKEEWKDRAIKKNEKYYFPQGEDITKKTKKELLKETEELHLKGTISFFVKKYNIYSGYINELTTKQKIIEKAIKLYSYKNVKLCFEEIDNKSIVLVAACKDKQEVVDFFKEISGHYVKNIQLLETKIETNGKNKQEIILAGQLKTKKEYEKITKELEEEAQKIYGYFQIIEKVNQQIKIARGKKIAPEEIIKTLNDYFAKNYTELKIKSIDTKETSYVLEIKDK